MSHTQKRDNMPILQLGTHIAVINTTAATMPELQKIGHISTEFAIWLDATRRIQVINQGMSLQTDAINQMLQAPNMYDSIVRSRLAAAIGYRPPLATQDGTLTELGNDRADLLRPIITRLADETPELLRSPQSWTKADQAFLSMTIMLRQAKLLSAIRKATKQLETTENRTGAILHQERPKSADNDQNNQNESSVRILDFTQIDDRRNESLIDTMQLPGFVMESLPPGQNEKVRQGWLVTSNLSASGKNDIKTLLRFGLLDRRAMLKAGRGRPASIVRVSFPGQLLLNDLRREGLV